jgi:hypothetical protein
MKGVVVLEMVAVRFRGGHAYGFGVSQCGDEYVIAIRPGLARAIALGIDRGRRPIVASEHPLMGPDVVPWVPRPTPPTSPAAEVTVRRVASR